MNLLLFLKGYSMGFSIAAIIGPMVIMTMRRTLAEGQIVGFAMGIGAACGSVFYGLIAGFGLTFVSSYLLSYQLVFRTLGSLFLFYLGFKTFFENPAEKVTNPVKIGSKGFLNIAFSTFLFDLSNPITIISLGAIFTSLGIGTKITHYSSVLALVFGLFMGSITWNILLTSFLTFFHTKITPPYLKLINKISGCILISFGALNLIHMYLK